MRDRAENQIKQIELILLRHGETASNQEHRYLGRTEEDLSAEGIEKLQKEKEKGSGRSVDILFCSPMKRCIQTAQILYPDKKPFLIPEWREMDFGRFEGKNYPELQNDPQYQAWIDSNGTIPFPDGESREGFIDRCSRGLYRMCEQLTTKEYFKKSGKDKKSGEASRNVVAGAVVHGGTIMALLSRFGGGDYFDYQVSNGHGYSCILQWEPDRIVLGIRKKI